MRHGPTSEPPLVLPSASRILAFSSIAGAMTVFGQTAGISEMPSENRGMNDLIHIGHVAARAGVSSRTVRHDQSVGRVVPSGRTKGGFRRHTGPDVRRLLLIRSLKPADFSLEQLEEIVTLRDAIVDGGAPAEVVSRYQAIIAEAVHRIRLQRERLVAAELAVELLPSTLPEAVAPVPGSR
jgi:DNA-binding transcriptional MerR regulator